MYIAILGRQDSLGLAELERRYGLEHVAPIGEHAALLTDVEPNLSDLGGSVKLGRVVSQTASNGWLGVSKQAVKYAVSELSHVDAKITLGFSAYGFKITARDVQKTGLVIKTRLKSTNGSVRLIPNEDTALSSAQVFHNKLTNGQTKRELLLVNGNNGRGYIAETVGVQNIDAYTLRDRGRPKRDPLNGMLPPKLAQIMINLGIGQAAKPVNVLDPFCGTGVILQEALLMGYSASGTDLNPKMAEFTKANLDWLGRTFDHHGVVGKVRQGDAVSFLWDESHDNLTSIVSETYLGEPMAQAPSSEKLAKVMEKCNGIIRNFLLNAHDQFGEETTLCIAVPAWRMNDETAHLPVVDELSELGYNRIDFQHVSKSDLLYFREDQVVAREILVLSRS